MFTRFQNRIVVAAAGVSVFALALSSTSLSGLQGQIDICDYLPKLKQCQDKKNSGSFTMPSTPQPPTSPVPPPQRPPANGSNMGQSGESGNGDISGVGGGDTNDGGSGLMDRGGGSTQSGCGNGVCENYYSCPVNAGRGVRAAERETEANCPRDCKPEGPVCGNGKCEAPRETSSTCPKDCRVGTVQAGNLYVTQDGIPAKIQLIVGGTEGSSALNLKFRADGIEDIRVLQMQITDASTDAPYDHLNLYSGESTTPFAKATVAACGNEIVPAHTLCADLSAANFVVKKNTEVRVAVKPVIKTDTGGAFSGTPVQLFLSTTYDKAVTAAGVTSNVNLLRNNGNTTTEGEVFTGTNSAGPNREIAGPKNATVLSKIISVTNANPDADGSIIPNGLSDIGQFKFVAAKQFNAENGVNKPTLSDMIFSVKSEYVEVGALKLINKMNGAAAVTCEAFNAEGQKMTMPVKGNFFAWCKDLPSFIDSAIEQGGEQTFVLQMNITNSATSREHDSTVQVMLENFAKSDFQSADFGLAASHLQWIDRDADTLGNGDTTSSVLRWTDLPTETVKSTLYKNGSGGGGGGGGGSGAVCGNGKCEAPDETSSNCSQDCRDEGPVCGNGRCEAPQENSSTCSRDCGSGTAMCPNDPDGGDPTQKATVNYKTDNCRQGIKNYVNEILCVGGDGKQVYESLTPCPLGKECVNGACTADGGPTTDPKCSDTDGGINIFVRGTAGRSTDVCNGNSGYEKQVYEAYCTATSPSFAIMPSIPCPEGYTCSSGACVRQ
ncbi:MAG: hypothetical protein HOO67_03540 [Candidatus Peribacteraceae bacterium]|nr:hypothetical protein [Candidatus Peribacteraceae bacterium]